MKQEQEIDQKSKNRKENGSGTAKIWKVYYVLADFERLFIVLLSYLVAK